MFAFLRICDAVLIAVKMDEPGEQKFKRPVKGFGLSSLPDRVS